jgi:hypothetical protein
MDNKDVLIANLLDGWEESLRILDSYRPLVVQVPDWLEQMKENYKNPEMTRKTAEKFAAMRLAAQSVCEGRTGLEVWRQVLSELHQPPPGSVH